MARTCANCVQTPNTFFYSLKPLFFLGVIIGVLPISGITGKTPEALKFSWKNGWMLYSTSLFLITLLFNIFSTIENVRNGIRLDNFGSTVFYSVCNLNSIFFVALASELSSICHYVHHLETFLGFHGHPKFINLHIKMYLGIAVCLSFVEHFLMTYLSVKGALEDIEVSHAPFIEVFFQYRFPEILKYVGHHDFTAVAVLFINFVITLNWNYLDYFIACVCMQISGKIAMLNRTMRQSNMKHWNESQWRKISYDYNRLSLLTKAIDRRISKMVLVSYASNLYHLSLQLLRSLRLNGDIYALSYFFFSLGYLIIRMMSVSLCAASICDESRASRRTLYTIQDPGPAASRLLHQIVTDDICITGQRFFVVNRGFIVKMFGTLITYEIILLQLNALRYGTAEL